MNYLGPISLCIMADPSNRAQKFDISNCNISGTAGPILKNEIVLQSSQQDLSNGTI